ncbi:hypothetical protein [uncultured Tolumonas sp.]|uniref:hypothetical protein n=1 Tax=uncultured Tolumonas sp. TaxID=263765 RepID=UPI002A0A21FD|nr:hypothetical protein [uncultured Tolumonas sp.]
MSVNQKGKFSNIITLGIISILVSSVLSACSSAPGASISKTQEIDKSSEYLSYTRTNTEFIGFDIADGSLHNVHVMDGNKGQIEDAADKMHQNNYGKKRIYSDCIIVRLNAYAPCTNLHDDRRQISVFNKREYAGNLVTSTLALGVSPVFIVADTLKAGSDEVPYETTSHLMNTQTNLVTDNDVVYSIGRIVVANRLEQIKQEAAAIENADSMLKVRNFTTKYPGYPKNTIFVRNLMNKKIAENDISAIVAIVNQLPEYASKTDAVSWLRTLNTFEGYKSAFDLTGAMEDAKSANNVAKTHSDRVELEHMALTLMGRNKVKAFALSSGDLDQSSTSHSEGGGFFLKGAETASNTFSINMRLLNNKEVLDLKDGDYKVKVKVKLSIPVHFRRASRWVGNADEHKNDEYTKEITIAYNSNSLHVEQVNFDGVRTAYKDRGIMGGTTEVQMVGDPIVVAEVIDITY